MQVLKDFLRKLSNIVIDLCTGLGFEFSYIELSAQNLAISYIDHGMSADKFTSINLTHSTFSSIKYTALKLTKFSNFTCRYCIFKDNFNSLVYSNENSNLQLIDSVISNNNNNKTHLFTLIGGNHSMSNVTVTKNKVFYFSYFSLLKLKIEFDSCNFINNEIYFSDSILVSSSISEISLTDCVLRQDTFMKGYFLNQGVRVLGC